MAPLAYAVGAALGAAALEAAAQAVAETDELIVTATRRSLDVQDVPLNIAVLPGAELDKR